MLREIFAAGYSSINIPEMTACVALHQTTLQAKGVSYLNERETRLDPLKFFQSKVKFLPDRFGHQPLKETVAD